MTIPPESLEVGKCYLTLSQLGPRIQWIIAVFPDGRVQHEWRKQQRQAWRPGILDAREFALGVDRETPCDWMPEMED